MKVLYRSLFLIHFFLSALITNAQQIAGGEITYTCGGNDNYTVKLVLYAKCPNPNLPTTVSLNIFSGSSGTAGTASPMNTTGSDQIIQSCPSKQSACSGGTGETAEAITKRTYTATIKLPSKRNDWTVYIQEGPRTILSSVTTPGPMTLSAQINNSGTFCNSSATFENDPLFFSSSKQVVSYDPGIKNPDTDNLQIALVSPRNSLPSPLIYKPGYSATNPITGAINVNPTNGKLTFTPSNPQETSVMAIQVKETRGGVFIGSAMREMYFQTLSEQTSPPVLAGQDTIKICQGDPISAKISGTSSSSPNLDLVFNNQSAWPNSNANIIKSNGSVELNLNSFSSFTGVRPITVTLIDDKCGSVTRTYYVKITPKPRITNPVDPELTVLCLKDLKVSINVADGKPPYKYLWSTGETTQSIEIKSATDHFVVVTDANGCSSAPWIKRIKSPINFEVGTIRCVDSLFKFYDVSRGQNTFPVSQANPLDVTTKWTWDFGDGPLVAGSSISHKFSQTGTYPVKLTVSDGKGCDNFLTKNIKVYGKPKVNFSFFDTCQVTEESDLTVLENIERDTTIQPLKILYYVDKVFRTFSKGVSTDLSESLPGQHTVKIQATTDAGCVDTLSKKVNVKPKPRITESPLRREYFYRCDSPGFPDTTFIYKATPVGEALNKPFKYTIDRFGMSKLENENYVPNSTITVPYTVTLNPYSDPATPQTITFKTKDVFGCTNDTLLKIWDPITPKISLQKYYCFLNDTLKLRDNSYNPSKYRWGLKTSVWDMKDGKTETTFGFANHAYSTLDEANVLLKVTDVTGCTDKDSIQIYLSEPDTSQFKIIKPLACLNEKVNILGIKNNYINSWYYRYADTVTSIYDSPDKLVINPQANFGKSTPANLDDIKTFESKKYNASTVIFYNEKDPALNLIRISNNPVKNIPSNVCHIQVTRPWRVLDRQPFKINETYDHCFDSIKIFDASLLDTLRPFTKIDTSSWKWTLYSPKNLKLDENSGVLYQPQTSLFTEVSSVRLSQISKYIPYTVKSSYQYTYKLGNDSLTCIDSTSIKVANEKVSFDLDSIIVTCTNYNRDVTFKSSLFLERLDVNGTEIKEWENMEWSYGNTSLPKGYPLKAFFTQPDTIDLKANIKNYYGCSASDSMIIIVLPSPIAKLAIDTVCYGLNSMMNGDSSIAAASNSAINTYYWFYSPNIPVLGEDPNTPDTTLAAKITKTSNFTDKFEVGTYPVGLAVRDNNGCYSRSAIKYSKVNDLPGIDFTALAKSTQDQDYLGNEPIQLIPSPTPNVAYSRWNLGDGNIQQDSTNNFAIEYTYPYYAPPFPKDKNMYDVTLLVKTKEGCVDSVTKKLDVNVYFELPNVFSPNEDGLHDNLLGVGKGIKEIKEFKIFNRWGEVIHTVSGIPEKDALKRGYLLWDGVYNGQVQPVGTYVYYAVVKTGYGNDLIKKGNLTLLK